jgi:hypothetical protein
MKTINRAIPYLHPKLPFRVSVGESCLDLAQLVIQRSARKYRHLHTEEVSYFPTVRCSRFGFDFGLE